MSTDIKYETCTFCSGTGYVKRLVPSMRGKVSTIIPISFMCTYCGGSGRIKKQG